MSLKKRYNNEAMIPPNLGDTWIPNILISIDKETRHAILDLGSNVSVISEELFELLNLHGNCSINLLLDDDSTKKALGRVNDVMVELHITYVAVDFIVMAISSNTFSPISLGRPFLRTT
jgi:hypothetical protein